MHTEKTASLEALIREWEAELGPETLAQARYQERMRAVHFFTGLAVPLVLVLLWIPTGWAVALREALHANRSWWGTWAALLLFLVSEAVLALPLSWFFDFRVETRLGLNRQSFLGWLWDEFKQAALSLPLQSLLFLGLYYVFRAWPQRWPIGIAAVVAVFLVVAYLLQPVFLRLKYKTQPLEDPDLEARIRRLFEKAGVPFAGLSVLQAGEKTARSNAALVPRGAGTEVVLFDTLLEGMSPEAIEAVVAHELGHKVHRDMLKLMVLLGAAMMLSLAAGYAILQRLGTWDGLQGPGDVATFPLLVWILAWLLAGVQVLLNAYMRRIEYAADHFALELTQNPDALEESFRVLARQNKALPQPPAWIEYLFHNHPSLARRVQRVRRYSTRWRAGEKTGPHSTTRPLS